MHRKVQVWIIVRNPRRPRTGWKVLLLKMIRKRGGYWQPVTGSVEKGESLPDAALREATEETSLRFTTKRPVNLKHSFRFESRWGGLSEEHAFYLIAQSREDAALLPKVQLDPSEHLDYEWVNPSQASRWLRFSSNRKVLRLLRQELAKSRDKTWAPKNKKKKGH